MADTAYGLHLAADLIGGTTQGMDVDKLSREKLFEMIEERTKARNLAIAKIMGQLAIPTTSRGALIGQQPEIHDWNKATELTRERRQRTAGLTGVGFPVYKLVARSGWSRDYLAKATNREILATYESFLNAHKSANYKDALRAIFRTTAYTWNDEVFPEDGDLKVFPLVGADSDFTPPPFGTNTFAGTHDHYLTEGGTLADADLTTLADEIREHGYGVSAAAGGFGGEIVIWINSAQRSTVTGFTNHVDLKDPNVLYAVLNSTSFAKEKGDVQIDTYLGYNTAARAWIREMDFVPASYQLAFATTTLKDGEINAFAPLRRRIPSTAALQGIRRFDNDKDYPLVDSWWEDWFGYGVYNRISAAVNYMHADTWADPDIT